ncbi:HAD family hydrolase [Candidatus Shapirobacteria bacterium]|nr:HAD family hydrolase [Candidatus Shapirobacteria bacterium]
MSKTLITRTKKWLKQRGIEWVIWDLDDTLLETYELFVAKIDKFYKSVCGRLPSGLSQEDFRKIIYKIIARVRKRRSVNPIFWQDVIEQLANKYPDVEPNVFSDNLSVLLEVYQEASALVPNALEVLKIFRKTKIKMAVLTHASQEWTDIKLKTHGLSKFFKDVFTASIDDFKGTKHWQEAIASLGVDPKKVLVVGDSVEGDIRAARKAGVKHLVYVGSSWDLHARGEMPERVIEVENLEGIFGIFSEQEI